MKTSDIAVGIGYTFAFLLGMLVASYYPLPGINVLECPECEECATGFATLEDMSSLVEELQLCKGVAK